MLKLLFKTLGVVLMLVAPVISGLAFYEYVQIKWLHHKPTYPFGITLSKALHATQIDFINSYQNEMLGIGLVFLFITILAYVSMLIKTMFNLIKVAIISSLLYLVYAYIK